VTPESIQAPAVRREPLWSYEDLAVFVFLAIPCLLVGAVVGRLLTAVLPATPVAKAALVLGSQFLAYLLWYVALALILKFRYDAQFWHSLGWNVPTREIGPAVISGLCLAVIVGMAGAAMNTPHIDSTLKELLQDRPSLVLVGLFAVTAGPICEELAFRGFMMPLLARSFGIAAGIILTAIPFALLHGPQYSWAWQYLVLLTLVGSAFGWARYRSGSTAVAAVMHAAYNLTFMVAYAYSNPLPQSAGGALITW
jgi:membrane protease YdiL (CAAX protease family)